LLHKEAVGALCDESGDYQAERREQDHDERDRDIDGQHEEQGPEYGEHTGEKLSEAHEQAVREEIDVADHAADEISRRVTVEVAERQRLDLRDRGVAQAQADVVGDAVVGDAQHPLSRRGDHGDHCDAEQNIFHAVKIDFSFLDHEIDRTPCEDGNVQLSDHGYRSGGDADRHHCTVRGKQLQHAAQRVAVLGIPHFFQIFQMTHSASFQAVSALLNWLSQISR
jgi:hypothetical protein